MKKPRILLIDLETAYIIFYGWAMFQEITDIKQIRRNWFVLCWSAKFLDEKKMYHSKLPDFRGYKPLPSKTEKNIDKEVMQGLWNLMNDADICIAHNISSFDRKKANTRFFINGIKPPSPYKVIDTLTSSRSEFKFTSNKLAYVTKKAKVTQKMESGGHNLWIGCEDGVKKDWLKMQKYCDQDVRALEAYYKKIRPWIRNHPNLNLYREGEGCPTCQSFDIIRNGNYYLESGVYQRYACKGCGSNLKEAKKTDRKSVAK